MAIFDASRIRNLFFKAISCLLAVVMSVSLCPVPAQAAVEPTNKQVLAALKKYDPDGYYIVKKTYKETSFSLGEYWSGRELYENLDGFDTAVHEQCHSYNTLSWDEYPYYIGKKKGVKVETTKVFNSRKLANTVPKQLRESRWDTYIGVPKSEAAQLASCCDGVYGLLDEFTAYCWGFNSYVRLYAYAEQALSPGDRLGEYFNGDVDVAYPEFRYFIEHYLYYAKKHKPKVYKGIMNNKKFKKVMRKIDAKYSSVVKEYDAHLVDTAFENGLKTLKRRKHPEKYLPGIYVNEYNLFAAELAKPRYARIAKKLGLKPVSLRDPEAKLVARLGDATSPSSLAAAGIFGASHADDAVSVIAGQARLRSSLGWWM